MEGIEGRDLIVLLDSLASRHGLHSVSRRFERLALMGCWVRDPARDSRACWDHRP